MDRLSKLFTVILFLFVAISIPVTTYLLQQETDTRSEASFELPVSLITDTGQNNPETDTGTTTGAPEITLVWPFLGKVGDAVAIYGHNFGIDPTEYMVFFGPTAISQEDIIQWSSTQIFFTIPELPVGQLTAPITVMTVGVSSTWDKPFIIYDMNTSMQVMKPSTAITTSNIPVTFFVDVYLDDGNVISARPGSSTEIPSGRSVLSVVVKDPSGVSKPFFVEPTEFGF
jgi:hypothetical protein